MRIRRLALSASIALASVLAPASPPVAAAGATGVGLVPVVPTRLMDSRPGGTTVDRYYAGRGFVRAGTTNEVRVASRGGVSGDAIAVMLNVTVVRPAADGYVTVYSCGAKRPNASSVNFTAGQVTSNAVFVRPGDVGRVCIFSSADTDVVVDAMGSVPPGGAPRAVGPARVVDTRPLGTTVDGRSAAGGALAAGRTLTLPVAGRAGIPTDASAVVLNVTAVAPAAAGFLTVYPCGSPRPEASSLNYVAGQVVPNLVLARVGDGGAVCIYTKATVQLVADATGFVPAASAPETVVPARIADTRPLGRTVDGTAQRGGVVRAGTTLAVPVSGRGGVDTGATSVMLNVTAVGPTGPGHLTVHPCGQPRPATSNVNYSAGQVVPNAVLAEIGEAGEICIYSHADTHVVVDVVAWMTLPSAPPLPPPHRIAAGRAHSCVIRDDATIACWGADDQGQSSPPGGTFTQVDANGDQTCALRTDDSVTCWGVDVFGQPATSPTGAFAEIAVGSAFGCGLTDGSRTVSCWPEAPIPLPPPSAGGLHDIVAGDYHACALRSDDTAVCWGLDGSRQATPHPGTFVRLASDSVRTCGIRGNGTISCWGPFAAPTDGPRAGTYVQLAGGPGEFCGLGNAAGVRCFGQVFGAWTPPTGAFTDVAIGQRHACGRRTDGSVACWGDDDEGQATPPP